MRAPHEAGHADLRTVMSTSFPVPSRGAKASTLLWADEESIEHDARNQLRRVSSLPGCTGVRVMPDVHVGKGATVGSVIAMRDAVCPAAVGVDIGCGMSAVRTDLTAEDPPDDLSGIRLAIEAVVPVGFRSHERPVNVRKLPGPGWDVLGPVHRPASWVRQLDTRAGKQLHARQRQPLHRGLPLTTRARCGSCCIPDPATSV